MLRPTFAAVAKNHSDHFVDTHPAARAMPAAAPVTARAYAMAKRIVDAKMIGDYVALANRLTVLECGRPLYTSVRGARLGFD
jgi:hypothetical protein